MSNLTESVCPDLENDGQLELSPGVGAAGLALFLFASVYYIATIIWWIVRRKAYRLRKRNFGLMCLSAFGGYLQLCISGLGSFVGKDNIPCDLYLWFVFLIIPLAAGPIAVRLIIFYNQANFNRLLVKESAFGFQIFERFERLSTRRAVLLLCCPWRKVDEESNHGRKTVIDGFGATEQGGDGPEMEHDNNIFWKRERLALAVRLSTTRLYQNILLATIFLMSLLSIFAQYWKEGSPFGHNCYGCVLDDPSTILFSLIVLFVVLVGLFLLCKIHREPDPLRIVHELELCLVGGMVVVLGILLAIFDPNDLNADGLFEWQFITSFGILFVHFIQCPLQVIKTYCKPRGERIAMEDLTLEAVLGSSSGRQAFLKYLATEHSAENFYFWNTAISYNQEYNPNTAREKAEMITRTFLTDNSILQVNIGFKTRKDILKKMEDQSFLPPSDIFDQAQAEIFALMRTDSFSRFCASPLSTGWARTRPTSVMIPRKL